MKLSGFVVAAFFGFMFSGCATVPQAPHTAPAPDQAISVPPSDKAQIIFLQPFKPIGVVADTAIYEVTADDAKLLSILSSRSKFAVLVNPGKHMFMAAGLGAGGRVMSANVQAGKRYYVLSRFIAYVGYQLRPIRNSGPSDYNVNNPKFTTWLGETTVVGMTPAGESLYSNATVASKFKASGMDRWRRLSQDEREQLTLNAADSIDDKNGVRLDHP